MKKLLGLSLLMCTSFVGAKEMFDTERSEWHLKFGGWSKHQKLDLFDKKYLKENGEKFEYNENHNGLGILYKLPINKTNHYLSTDFWYMKDSYGEDAYNFSFAYEYKFDLKTIESINLGLALTYSDRSVMIFDPYYQKDSNGEFRMREEIYLERANVFYPLPYINVAFTEKFNADFAFMFKPSEFYVEESPFNHRLETEYQSIFFFRLGYKIN